MVIISKFVNLDKDGIENENGMSTLIGLPEAEQVFGKDLVFEFESLFCNAFGPNLRNELAHGLLHENSCNSSPRYLCMVACFKNNIQYMVELSEPYF